MKVVAVLFLLCCGLSGIHGEQSDIYDELRKMRIDLDNTVRDLEKLKTTYEGRKIAFSAGISASATKYIGPFDHEFNLLYDLVFTNIGNAYNPITGIFTAPVRGVYQFDFRVYGQGSATPGNSGVRLLRNGTNILIAYGRQGAGFIHSSNGVSQLLEVGDVVNLQLYPDSWIFDNINHYNTFSGHLLFPM
ncbi:complement C1q-like protein 2 [Clupea harengus]|uniref:Complement C1q-like protein 2 n=1 Tax=Clupea harengus TaxID=7950 RepID=A0A6P3W5M2_CLUHA|nr:complement C1q-like protein 2 [Clupea harengus]